MELLFSPRAELYDGAKLFYLSGLQYGCAKLVETQFAESLDVDQAVS